MEEHMKYNLLILLCFISIIAIGIGIHLTVVDNSSEAYTDLYVDSIITLPQVVLDIFFISTSLTIPYTLYKIRSEDTHRIIIVFLALIILTTLVYLIVVFGVPSSWKLDLISIVRPYYEAVQRYIFT